MGYIGGSSPHTWGIPKRHSRGGCRLRFIPTYVGHTHANNPAISRCTVHPHIREAYPGPLGAAVAGRGSSPHTWGIQLPGAHFVRRDRFIPTYVGHTVCIAPNQFFKSVHPHIRGAYITLASPKVPVTGSSPHTWGIPLPCMARRRTRRFIPTYVGHTQNPNNGANQQAVHPHIRGAYSSGAGASGGVCGSSPHTWGILLWARCGFHWQPVHPHIRGAYWAADVKRCTPCGSSPHTWGIRIGQNARDLSNRFIPTYVGHTPSKPTNSSALSVHPHIRGAYTG